MAKYEKRLIARSLRQQGLSVKTIAERVKVSKSTASLWVRDIILSIEQLETLKKQRIKGSEKGRLLGAFKQKQDRLKRIEEGKTIGAKLIGNFSKRDFLCAGIALYWAEGNKRMKIVEFCNSDPKLVVFLVKWFQTFFDLNIVDFKCYVGVNIMHKDREQDIKNYWSTVTGIPLYQFTKTSFKKSAAHKVYENFNEHYGTLSVKVLKSARILYKMAGLVEEFRSVSLSG